ncbi:MAG: hypothetical protein JSR69_15420 [Proteobacteria bacterium]|nr:hypothetical protein [Pseudomonadota bacterium]
MDFEHIDQLPKFGFCGGIPIAELQSSCKDVPQKQGVYLVVRKNEQPVSFLETSSGGHFKNRDPSVSVLTLEARWLALPKVVYVGKAGGKTHFATLQDRLHAYMQFGIGRRYAHWGGRYIWQLSDAGELLIFWKETMKEEPRLVEKQLLCEFFQTYEQLPFANLRK